MKRYLTISILFLVGTFLSVAASSFRPHADYDVGATKVEKSVMVNYMVADVDHLSLQALPAAVTSFEKSKNEPLLSISIEASPVSQLDRWRTRPQVLRHAAFNGFVKEKIYLYHCSIRQC